MWSVRFKRYDVNNLTKCHDCLAKYYCSGGCPELYCMHSFKLIVYTTNEREEQDYKSIINRFEKEEKLKMYNICYWLNGRKIEYIVRFNYIPRNGFKWNLVRYRNYLRLKVRLTKQ